MQSQSRRGVTVNFANAKPAGETPTVDLSDVSGSDLKAGVAGEFKGFWFGRAEWNELIAPNAEDGFQLRIS